MSGLIADRRLYLTADRSQVVEEGDPRAAFLLAGEGGQVPAEYVESLGLVVEDGKVVVSAEKPAAEPEEDVAETPEWPLKMEPEEYLARYGDDAKNSELARQVIAAREA